ncbi:hypothetical protein [Streptomyces vinaceus]|uniref:hypothetical protein n=1 Tax=Streptomyces vinaceus TaxID=1960 RepID=UPI00368C412E
MSVPMPHESSPATATDAKPGTLFLVGDVFAEFAHHEGVFTVSQLARLIRNGTFPESAAGPGGVRVSVGQGVSLFDVQYVRDTLARGGGGGQGGEAPPGAATPPRPGGAPQPPPPKLG